MTSFTRRSHEYDDTTTSTEATTSSGVRVLREGYGGEAWHGPDLKAALTDVSTALAFWRPAPGRHNIAEIALHHAYYAHSVRGRLSENAHPNRSCLRVRTGFRCRAQDKLTWKEIVATVDRQQQHLATLVSDIEAGRVRSRLSEAERFALVVGITCHAVYHAGTDTAAQEAARGRIDVRRGVGSRFAVNQAQNRGLTPL